MADNKTNRESSSVERLIPQQLVSGSEALIEFLKEYYNFLSQDQGPAQVINTIIQNKDLDRMLDSYIDSIHKELGYGLKTNYSANKINLYKRIGEFYRAKGSLDSIKSLFNILFNVDIEIILPKEQILVASDGRWIQQNVIFIELTSGDPFDGVNEFILIENPDNSTVTVEIERVRRTTVDGIYEITVSKNFVGTIQVDATIDDVFAGTLVSALGSYEIEYAGQNFEVGQILNITNGAADSSETKVKITEVDSNGGIVSFEFLEFGIGYGEDFTSYVIPRGYDSSFSTAFEDADFVGRVNDPVKAVEGGSLEIDPYSAGYFAEEYLQGQRFFGSFGSTYASDDVDLEEINDAEAALEAVAENFPTRAIINFINVPLAKYSGLFTSNKGFLSDDMYLQDNRYYQQYSYVIRTSRQYDEYKEALRKSAHPAGFEFFGQYEISNTFDVSTALQVLERFYRERLNDSVDTSDLAARLIEKPVADEIFATEDADYLLQKNLENTSTTSDENSYEYTKNVTDTSTTSDDIEDIAFNKNESDTATTSESVGKAGTKPLTDSSTISDAPAISMTIPVSDSVTISDSTQLLTNPEVLSEATATSDNISDIVFNKNPSDTATTSESVEFDSTKAITDSINTSEAGTINFNPYSVGYFASDYTEGLSSF